MDDFSTENSFELTVADTTARAVALIDDEVREVARASKGKNTLLAYRSNWTAFQAWCADRDATSLPAEPETVSAYLVARMKEGLKASSLAPHDRYGAGAEAARDRRTGFRDAGPFLAHDAGEARPRADPARHGRGVPSFRTGRARC